MADRLLVTVLGNRNSGKSSTWNHLFGRTVRTGIEERTLFVNQAEFVDAFLISGSPEERDRYVKDLLPKALPSIVLCSTQYVVEVKDTYDFFFDRGYEVFVQWLMPGYSDREPYEDTLGLRDYLLAKGATLQVRSGVVDLASRAKEIRQFVVGWATHRDLVRTEWPD